MPKRDFYHDAVKNALTKDGWTITDDPFTLEFEDLQLFADLAAEKPFAAEKGGRKIVIEIKVFTSPSPVSELEKAIGQYNIYSLFIKEVYPERELFLALAQSAHKTFFQRPSIRFIMSKQQISLLIFDPDTEEIIEWIS